ncbi:MAG: hypothetical protein F4X95_02400 [Oligoflexia bacterium]|nr:hypothetical protein [Bdellovibrionales bacterium]MYE07588.1 hypothetical protein [Oligoflexia bacterium]
MKWKTANFIKGIIFIVSIGFLSGCGDSSGNQVATDPTHNTPRKEIVNLRESFTGGAVSSINFQVSLPAGTKQSLLQYNGRVSIKGSIEMNKTKAPCLSTHSFSCDAELSSRSITTNGCSLSHGINILRIDIGEAPELKTTYSVVGIETSKIPFNCFLPQQ